MVGKNKSISILLVDDHPIVLSGIRHSLDGEFSELTIDYYESIAKATEQLKSPKLYDLIIVDLYIPGENTFEFISSLEATKPETPVIVFSATENVEDIKRAIQSGIVGIVSKSLLADELSNAVRTILDGDIYNSEWLIEIMEQSNLDNKNSINNLSYRQRQVLSYIDQGLTNKTVAKNMSISESTVKYHVKAIFLALGVNTRTACVYKARELGLIA